MERNNPWKIAAALLIGIGLGAAGMACFNHRSQANAWPGPSTAGTPRPATPSPGPSDTNVATTQEPSTQQTCASAGSFEQHTDWKEVPLDPAVEKALAWLVSTQGDDGGWGQDGGHQNDARKEVALESQGNDVANTAIACLALLRAGNLPERGKYHEALSKGVAFILSHVEKAPAEGLDLGDANGAQIKRKLGQHVDTFLATMVLSQIKGRSLDAALRARAEEASKKCVAKVETNQGKDGSWNSGGWAPVVATGFASRGLYEAQQNRIAVKAEVQEKAQEWSKRNCDVARASFDAGKGGAGVELYVAAQTLENNSRTRSDQVANAPIINASTKRIDEGTILNGFGSMGGEEFVSYMNISDSLCRVGGEKWTSWNGKIKEHLLKLQNADGTWCGQHCITGRVACTSAAVMTLISERTLPKQ